MEFLADYASFLAKTLTVVLAILVVLLTVAALRGRDGVAECQIELARIFQIGRGRSNDHKCAGHVTQGENRTQEGCGGLVGVGLHDEAGFAMCGLTVDQRRAVLGGDNNRR